MKNLVWIRFYEMLYDLGRDSTRLKSAVSPLMHLHSTITYCIVLLYFYLTNLKIQLPAIIWKNYILALRISRLPFTFCRKYFLFDPFNLRAPIIYLVKPKTRRQELNISKREIDVMKKWNGIRVTSIKLKHLISAMSHYQWTKQNC